MATEVFAHGNELPGHTLATILEEALRETTPSALAIASAYVSIYGTGFIQRQRHNLEIAEVRLVCDISDEDVTAQVLEVSGNTFTTTDMCADGTVETSMGTFTIVDENTIQVIELGESDNISATLTNNGARLTVIDEDDDVIIYNKR